MGTKARLGSPAASRFAKKAGGTWWLLAGLSGGGTGDGGNKVKAPLKMNCLFSFALLEKPRQAALGRWALKE